MPLLCENYKINNEKSVLFGHSQGGVFTHYAAFNSDQYENQPFGKYVIGSPTFWTPYFTCASDWEEYENEYGYFDRNETFDKELFITGGTLEDEDFADYYAGNPSTLEGIKNLENRLNEHNVGSFTIKYYESHHSDYVGDMILDSVK